jgi:hypothetical protein
MASGAGSSLRRVPRYVTVATAAGELEVTEQAVRKQCRNGTLLGAHLGPNGWRIPAAAVSRRRRIKDTRGDDDGAARLVDEMHDLIDDLAAHITETGQSPSDQLVRAVRDLAPSLRRFATAVRSTAAAREA